MREAIAHLFNFEWSNESLFYGQYARVHSFWENSEFAATGKPTEAELALLEPLADVLPDGILTENPVMGVTSGMRATDRNNLRIASNLLAEAGWIVGDDGLRRNSNGDTLKVDKIYQTIKDLNASIQQEKIEAIIDYGLHEFVSQFIKKISSVDSDIQKEFFY